jgi:hypothetical protein
MKIYKIQPEYSSQGTTSKPNPFVKIVLDKLINEKRYGLKGQLKIVDLGCGKLRHLNILNNYSKHVILVDTKVQIDRVQKLGNMTGTIKQYLQNIDLPGAAIKVIETRSFELQSNKVDVILSIAVMDVVLMYDRIQMTKAAFNNLRSGGFFVVIIPRNDSATLINCTKENQYEDGFVLKNRGHNIFTFYKNYWDINNLLELFIGNGFHLVDNLSVFRHVCLILQKP